METIEESFGITYERPGPWENEPDKRQWQDNETGLPCLIVRNGVGALCGYVGVPSSHPWYEKSYCDVDASVHGGLTFSDHCQEGGKICHIVEDGENDDVWWVGFDCAHLGDMSPIGLFSLFGSEGTYRDIRYVTNEVESLARQAKAAE